MRNKSLPKETQIDLAYMRFKIEDEGLGYALLSYYGSKNFDIPAIPGLLDAYNAFIKAAQTIERLLPTEKEAQQILVDFEGLEVVEDEDESL